MGLGNDASAELPIGLRKRRVRRPQTVPTLALLQAIMLWAYLTWCNGTAAYSRLDRRWSLP